MPYDQALKRKTHESIESVFIDKKRHAEIAAGVSSSSTPPPPLPMPVEISPNRSEHDMDA